MAYANAGAEPKAIKPASIESSIEDFDPVLTRLESLANRASSCGDRLTGPRPTGVEGSKDAPAPNHLIYALQSRRERLVRVADHFEAEIQRIENGLA